MIRLLKNFRWYYWLIFLLICGLVFIQVRIDLKMPELLTKILNNVGVLSNLRDRGIEITPEMITNSKAEIWDNGLKMLMYAGISVVVTILVSFCAARVGAGFSHDLRGRVYRKVQDFSMAEIDSFSTSSLITRSTNDISQVQMVIVMVLRMAISAPLMAIEGIMKATKQASSSNLNIIVIIAVICLVVLVITLFLFVMPKFKKIQSLTDRLNQVTRENLTGIRVVRANNAQGYQESKFGKVNTEVTKTNVFVNRVMSLMQPGMMIIMNVTSLVILWVGAYAIQSKTLLIGDVFGFQQYTMIICMSFMQLIFILIMVPRGQVSANRINQVLYSHTSITDPETGATSTMKGTIEFKNVSFAYPNSDEPVLRDISFQVNAGETLAIIGSTGSGKSTMLNLLNRFYDATEGEVLVDGINVKEFTQHDLHEKIAFIPQKSNLFIGSIKSNLEFGKNNPTEEEIERALKVSQAYEFVSKLPDGIEAKVAQGGSNFSGGQKQRLCIARAVIKNPEIFAFDDSFSALDLKTDQALRQALAEDEHQATNIIIGQRIGTIMNADKILVLEKGQIVGMGTHQELLKSCEVYQEIAHSQLTEEELNHAW